MNSKPLELWDHQKAIVPKLLNASEYALFWEMGCGKTAAMIHGLRQMYTHAGRHLSTLIFAPPIVLRNWKNEFRMHSKISSDRIIVLDGSGAKRTKEFLKARENFLGEMIVVTNYESVQMSDLYKHLMAWKPEVIVCDESHRLKNHQSKRAQLVLKLARGAKRRYLMTGTPVLNSALDVFMQFRIMEGDKSSHAGATFGDNFFAFRAQFFQDVNASWKDKHNYFPKWEPRVTTHSTMQDMIYKKASRVVKSECMSLPPLVRQTIEIDLSPEQRRLYEEMKKDYITFLDNHKNEPRAVVAQMALTKALRLQQICSGFVKTDSDEEIELKNTPRNTALAELLEDLSPHSKVIVWAVFRRNYLQIAKICEKLALPFTMLTGEQSAKEKTEQVYKFENDPTVRVMIANQGAGGVGVNLVAASYSIYYSRNFSLEADLQSEARNYRGGSERHEKITRIDLVAPKTIDALVLQALATKQTVSNQILDWSQYL